MFRNRPRSPVTREVVVQACGHMAKEKSLLDLWRFLFCSSCVLGGKYAQNSHSNAGQTESENLRCIDSTVLTPKSTNIGTPAIGSGYPRPSGLDLSSGLSLLAIEKTGGGRSTELARTTHVYLYEAVHSCPNRPCHTNLSTLCV